MFKGLKNIKRHDMAPKNETIGKGQTFLNGLVIVVSLGVIGLGVAWGSLTRQVIIDSASVEDQKAITGNLQRQVERQDEAIRNITKILDLYRVENREDHQQIMSGLDELKKTGLR